MAIARSIGYFVVDPPRLKRQRAEQVYEAHECQRHRDRRGQFHDAALAQAIDNGGVENENEDERENVIDHHGEHAENVVETVVANRALRVFSHGQIVRREENERIGEIRDEQWFEPSARVHFNHEEKPGRDERGNEHDDHDEEQRLPVGEDRLVIVG